MARVLVVGDTHCPTMHTDYIDFLCDIRDHWECDKGVHIGDMSTGPASPTTPRLQA